MTQRALVELADRISANYYRKAMPDEYYLPPVTLDELGLICTALRAAPAPGGIEAREYCCHGIERTDCEQCSRALQSQPVQPAGKGEQEPTVPAVLLTALIGNIREYERHGSINTPVANEICLYLNRALEHGAASPVRVRATIIEILGYHFATLVSGNNQPHMSGDPRNRLPSHRRRHFDDACESAADAILASLSDRGGK